MGTDLCRVVPRRVERRVSTRPLSWPISCPRRFVSLGRQYAAVLSTPPAGFDLAPKQFGPGRCSSDRMRPDRGRNRDQPPARLGYVPRPPASLSMGPSRELTICWRSDFQEDVVPRSPCVRTPSFDCRTPSSSRRRTRSSTPRAILQVLREPCCSWRDRISPWPSSAFLPPFGSLPCAVWAAC